MPNRWWASITSRPLFISVAESTVIFAPMLHVGMGERVGHRDLGERLRRAAPERPTRGGDDDAGDGAVGRALEALGERGVLAVDREHAPPAARVGGRDELAAGDQALLVRERQVGAGGEGGKRRAQAGGAHDRVQDDVRAAARDEPLDALGPLEHLAGRTPSGRRQRRPRRPARCGRPRAARRPRPGRRGRSGRQGRTPRARGGPRRSRAPAFRSSRSRPGRPRISSPQCRRRE